MVRYAVRGTSDDFFCMLFLVKRAVSQSLSSANIAICPRKGFPSFMGHTFSIVLYGHLHDLLLLSSRMNDGLSAADHPLIP